MRLIRIIKVHSFSIYYKKDRPRLENHCFFKCEDYKDPHTKHPEFQRLKLIDPLRIFKHNPFIVSCSEYEEIPNGGTFPRTNDEQGPDQTDHE